MALLTLTNVEVVYDKVFLASKGVSITIPEGGLVALLGANGAGKSTTLKAISGLLRAERGLVSRGEIQFDGGSILDWEPDRRVRAGIVHVLEGRRVFGQLTPRENLLAAARPGAGTSRTEAQIERIMAWFPRLAARAGARAGYLSGGEQQMLAIGRAMMTGPRLVLLDEPSLGLSPLLSTEIFAIIRTINAETGAAFLIVEQNAALALQTAREAYVMENGRIVLAGTADEVRANPDVTNAYLGGTGGKVDYAAIKHYSQRKRWLS